MSLKLGFSSDDYGFAIDLGLPLQLGETIVLGEEPPAWNSPLR